MKNTVLICSVNLPCSKSESLYGKFELPPVKPISLFLSSVFYHYDCIHHDYDQVYNYKDDKNSINFAVYIPKPK